LDLNKMSKSNIFVAINRKLLVPLKQRGYLLSVESEHYRLYLKGATTLDFLKVFWERFTVLSQKDVKVDHFIYKVSKIT
jgi:hypothetical protein